MTSGTNIGRLCVAAALLAMTACATWHAPTNLSEAPLRARATTQTSRDVRLSAAVLSRDDAIRMFGVDLEAARVQPVWIEVRNDTQQALWLLRSGTDPDYFSPLEVAWGAHVTFGRNTNARIDEHFDQLSFHNPIPPGKVRSGILFTNPQPVTKLLNVDLLGDRTMIPFTLFVPVPDVAGATYQHLMHAYSLEELKQCEDLPSLRKAIEALPCCTSGAAGADAGEPLNIVIVGQLDDIGAAASRRGYRRVTDPDTSTSLFGRAPDLVARKRSQAGAPAIWLRFWRAPIAYREQSVFVVQAGRPVGGRFAGDGVAKLHPDVDEVRNTLIQDFLYSGGLEELGFATGVGLVPQAQPRKLPGDAHYYTDGLRAVLFFATRPLTFADVKLLDWESVPGITAGLKEASNAPH